MSEEFLAAHRWTHRALLSYLPSGPGGIDAIVVPASRPAAYLLPAMEVAAGLGCEFVALCSGRVRQDEAAGLAAEVPDLSWTLVAIDQKSGEGLLDFGTSDFRQAALSAVGDLSRKRNLGLLLAHLAGWRRIMFLDDDIRDVSPRALRAVAAKLGPGRAVGMLATDFPDNSVVCHASRLAGRRQDVFVSGSALAVDTTAIRSFFPEVYNEDWLFLHDAVRSRQVSAVGQVRQAPYRPYADRIRAVREEFGDLLAEGLMSLVHDRGELVVATRPAFWSQAIDQRVRLLDQISEGLVKRPHDRDRIPALRAVSAAQATLETFDGDVLARYVRRWRADVERWQWRLQKLPVAGSLKVAIQELELNAIDSRTGGSSPFQERATRASGSIRAHPWNRGRHVGTWGSVPLAANDDPATAALDGTSASRG